MAITSGTYTYKPDEVLFGESTDTKPTDAPTNTRFIELDTNTEWYFNGDTWKERGWNASAE